MSEVEATQSVPDSQEKSGADRVNTEETNGSTAEHTEKT